MPPTASLHLELAFQKGLRVKADAMLDSIDMQTLAFEDGKLSRYSAIVFASTYIPQGYRKLGGRYFCSA